MRRMLVGGRTEAIMLGDAESLIYTDLLTD
jgi:hypothetical protein